MRFDKITARVQRLCYNLDPNFVDAVKITQKVIIGVYPGVNTIELDNLAAEAAVGMASTHPDYLVLAGRIAVSNLHKQTAKLFSQVSKELYENRDSQTGNQSSFISKENYAVVQKYGTELDNAIYYERDFHFDYFGFKTLEKSYLLKINDTILERPQHMFMRIAIAIHGYNIEQVIETYNLMSQKYYIHSSPTLFNAGTPFSQLSLSFSVAMKDDSLEGIYDTLKNCALISKSTGGIGLHIHNVRATGSHISGTNGTSLGIIPMIRVFNNTARYVDQGGNKRPGAFALYLEPWHADIFDFINLRNGAGEGATRDIFPALWVPDMFMRRVESNSDWTLFSPNEAPGLSDTYGEEFDALYEKYESEGRGRKVVKAQELFYTILEAQTATGTPFVLYKDQCNKKLNQKNVGVIKSGNLCCEIIQHLSHDRVSAPMLALLALPEFIERDSETIWYNFDKLHLVTKIVTKNLNRLIDLNSYPIKEAEISNKENRPISIGVQGLADLFMMLRLPFESQDAKDLNIQIFETIYHAAIESSIELAQTDGLYPNYVGLPASKGILQFDLWNTKPTELYDWESTKEQMQKYGLRNALLVALMPTASTSKILGYNESFEPYTSNSFSVESVSGELHIFNPHLLKELVDMNLWNDTVKQAIISQNGSIQHIAEIPAELKQLYKTVWEIPQKNLIDMAGDRAAFIDQSQALNIYMKEPSQKKLTSMHFYGWKKGLKTGMYYLRTQASGVKYQMEKEKRRVVESVVPVVGKVAPKRYVARTPEVKPEVKPERTEHGTEVPSQVPGVFRESSLLASSMTDLRLEQ